MAIAPTGPINGYQAFIPSLIPPYPTVAGFRIFVGPPTGPIAGYVPVGGNTIAVPSGFVNVTPLSITYVYLDIATGTIRSNNTGFTGNIYPIAVVVTNQTEITSLVDARPDVSLASGGGGGGSTTDVVQTFTASGSIALAAGQNLFGTTIQTASSLQLPSPAGLGGQQVKIVKIDTAGTTAIGGAAQGSIFLTNVFQYVVFETDGLSWYVIGGN